MNILVIGSINIDEFHYVNDFPKVGETIFSHELKRFHGGKGANQAIAIKKLTQDNDTKIAIFAKVGNDESGAKEISNLKSNGVDVKFIKKSKLTSGKATIIISYLKQDNKIIVNKGANSDFGEKDKDDLKTAILSSDIVLIQLEINDWLVQEALKIAKKNNKIIVMNPTPAINFKMKYLKYVDWLIPNETELEFIANKQIININDIELTLNNLRTKGLKNSIVTLGASGVYVSTQKIKKWIPSVKVNAVDTTAAGDTFIGSFVANGLNGNDEKLISSIQDSAYAAALTVQKKGAQESIPTYKELQKWKKQF